MLRDGLRLIAGGEVTGIEDLASRLGVPPALAEGMVHELVRIGYLQTPDQACSSGCQGCPLGRQCAGRGYLYALTEKSKRAAAQT